MRNVIIFILLLLFSCGNHQKITDNTLILNETTFQNIKLIDTIQIINCTQNAALSYALIIPSNYDSNFKLPLVIAFDPHADGVFVLNKYKDLATKYGFALACSMDSKNGMATPETDGIAQTILNDCIHRLKIDQDRISAMGFSGGAKVAGAFAQSSTLVSTLICCGAVPNPQLFSLRQNLKLFLIAGEFDFNLLEAQELALNLLPSNQKFDFLQINAKHEWPDNKTMSDVFMRSNLLDLGLKQSAFANEVHASVTTNVGSSNLLNKAFYLRNLAQYFGEINKQSEFVKLIQSNEFSSFKQLYADNISKERVLFQTYIQYFGSKDLNWWKKESSTFTQLELKSKKTPNEVQKLRLKAYLGLAVYMYIQNVLNQNDLKSAAKLIEIYGFLESKNYEAKMLAAKYFIKINQPDEAIKQIQLAVKLGFKDEKRLYSEPDFQTLTNNMAFQVVLDEIRAKK